MSETVIKVENISKQYRLGQVGTGTLSHDINRWWHEIRGKQNPYLKIGEENDRTAKGDSDYVWALRDINFEVKQGEILGIIGRNGAGKSTLLKILSRTTTPTTGNIKIKGRVASLLEVGTGFHPELSGRDNIYLNGAILGMTKKEIHNKFDEIVDFAGVDRYIDTPVKRYSSGMYVRLAFAVAAHLDPEILIVDEVLAVGDAEFQKKCLGKMSSVSKGQGRTVLFVSHNTVAVRQLCNRGLVLENGKVITDDTVHKALSIYQNATRKIPFTPGGSIIHNANRRSTGQLQFASIDVHDTKRMSRNNFYMGETIQFTLSYEVYEQLHGLFISILFYSGTSKEILTNIRHIITSEVVHAGTKGSFTVEIPNNPFRPGEYPLYFCIGEAVEKSIKEDVLDDVTNPIIISARENETYGDFNPLTPVGFFSVTDSKIVQNSVRGV